jgi:hypothetical protein
MKALTVLLLVCAPLFSSCRVYPEQWVPQDVPMSSSMRLWEVSKLAMQKNGFPVIHVGFDPKSKMARSGWDYDLHPFKGRGIRERVHVRFKQGEKAGMLVLGIRVEQEVNDNLARPLDLSSADWASAGDNKGRSKVVMQYVSSLLGSRLELGKTLTEEEIEKRGEPDGF